MSENDQFQIKWFNRLQFRVVASFLSVCILMAIAILVISKTVGENIIQQQAYNKVVDAGGHVQMDLKHRTSTASAVVNAMATIAAEHFDGDELAISQLKALMNLPGALDLIAGGGIWPEPYAFDRSRERASFFWGRDASGQLIFFDQYNLQSGEGYHNEEWYVPVRYLEPGMEYWSKSYTDPYSRQPMVTVSAPIYKDGDFVGVATVDLKLEGLQKLLKRATSDFGGYAFLVDRNGRLLSFPDDSLAKIQTETREGGSLVPYIMIAELANRIPSYRAIEALLNNKINKLTEVHGNGPEMMSLASRMDKESYQIELSEAKMIAASIAGAENSHNQIWQLGSELLARTQIPSDYVLNESAFVSVVIMPNTLWQVVTIMPYSAARSETVMMFSKLLSVFVLTFFIALLVLWLLVRKHLTRPLALLSHQLRKLVTQVHSGTELVKTRDKGELGALTHWFNRRTRQLLESQKKVEQLAFYDSLTGLPNRRLLQDRLEALLAISNRGVCQGAILFLDLDNFKNINDTLGHTTGDRLLTEIAQKLATALRTEDIVARIGGDEFVIILVYDTLGKVKVAEHTAEVARKVIELLSETHYIEGTPYQITASMGISLFCGEDENSEDLLKQADTAMYQAKENGRNTYRFFKPSMQARVQQRLEIEKALRKGLLKHELQLLYQPQIDRNGQCQSAEALLRWNHPIQGVLTPDAFIPIAEDSPLIQLVGRWIFHDVCSQIKSWIDKGVEFNHIAINVSPRQFHHGDIVAEIQAMLTEFDVPADKLMLEITEGVIFQNTEETINKMTLLRKMGLSISIDDFGTGYSSLAYIKRLPINQLKIDQSFVAELVTEEHDLAIVETILSMAEHLDLEVIAEGVETIEQYYILRNRGCDLFQGYYFARPVTAEQIENCFRDNNCCYSGLSGDKRLCPMSDH